MPVIIQGIKNKFIKLFAFSLLLLISGQLFVMPAKAVPMDINSVPATAQLQGTNAGNIPSVTTLLSIPEFFASAIITRADLKFELGGTSSGTVGIYDQYLFSTTPDTPPLYILNLSETGTKTLNITATAANWQQNPAKNLGLFWRSVNLNPDDNIVMNNVLLTIDLVFPDTLKPLLTSGPEAQKIAGNKYRITVNFDEPVTSNLEYGKTVNYGITDNINIFQSELKYDLENLQSGVSYHYRIIATDAFGNKTITPDYSFIPVFGVTLVPTAALEFSLDLKLPAPQNLIAIYDNTSKEVKLSWDAVSVADVSGYRVFRRTTDVEQYEELARVGANTLIYYDTEFIAGKEYFYQVRTTAGLRESVGTASEVVKTAGVAALLPDFIKGSDPVVVGILAVSGFGLLVFGLVKLGKRFKNWLEPPKKKKSLDNVFRDPDSVW